jgi:hypothetical protein
LHPKAVYTIATATRTLSLKKTTLPREIRAGRLRVSRRGGKHFLLGEWLLEWLRAGEVKRRPQLHATGMHPQPGEAPAALPPAGAG